MVYLGEVIKQYQNELLTDGSMQAICYAFIANKDRLPREIDSNLGDEESLAIKGYLGIKASTEEIQIVLNKKPIKQIDYTKDVFKFLGICLASGNLLEEKLKNKFNESPLRYKYLISKIFPEYDEKFKASLQEISDDLPYHPILTYIFLDNRSDDVIAFISDLLNQEFDIIDLLIFKDLQTKALELSITRNFQNLTALEVIHQALLEFGNSVKKITRERRKGHNSFEINDEYDVQDLLYVVLKPLFPKLIVEDPAPRVGTAFTKVDISFREEGVVMEVKMIKSSDSDEKKFISQLKDDIESYYIYPYLKDLLVYVYDPENKTSDVQNFYALNGIRENKGKRFSVEVVVGN